MTTLPAADVDEAIDAIKDIMRRREGLILVLTDMEKDQKQFENECLQTLITEIHRLRLERAAAVEGLKSIKKVNRDVFMLDNKPLMNKHSEDTFLGESAVYKIIDETLQKLGEKV